MKIQALPDAKLIPTISFPVVKDYAEKRYISVVRKVIGPHWSEKTTKELLDRCKVKQQKNTTGVYIKFKSRESATILIGDSLRYGTIEAMQKQVDEEIVKVLIWLLYGKRGQCLENERLSW